MEGPLVDRFREAMIELPNRERIGELIQSNTSIKDCKAANLCEEQIRLADALFAWS
jgi:hypothetical protein